MNPEIAGVLITDHEVAEFVGGGSTAAAWITPKAHDRDRDIAIDHRCAFAGNIGDQNVLARTLAQVYERIDCATAQASDLR